MARKAGKKLAKAPNSEYSDGDGGVLTLRGSLTVGARKEYAETLGGKRAKPAASMEDVWQRAVELLFERLAVRWVINGVEIKRERELLARLRAASRAERSFVERALREHCEEWFPDVKAP
jgi:hypothetical protein